VIGKHDWILCVSRPSMRKPLRVTVMDFSVSISFSINEQLIELNFAKRIGNYYESWLIHYFFIQLNTEISLKTNQRLQNKVDKCTAIWGSAKIIVKSGPVAFFKYADDKNCEIFFCTFDSYVNYLLLSCYWSFRRFLLLMFTGSNHSKQSAENLFHINDNNKVMSIFVSEMLETQHGTSHREILWIEAIEKMS